MKGVILAGGRGVRLRPLTLVANKHLLPVYDEPMISHGVRTLVAAGIRELMIVTGPDHLSDFRELLGHGRRFGLTRLVWGRQPTEAGIADALRHAEKFAAGEPISVLLGDNLFGGKLRLKSFRGGARVFLKRVTDPRHYGVAELRGRQVRRIVEKPRQPRSNLAVVGLYLYDARVFDIIRDLKPSARGELEISDVNSAYLERGQLDWEMVRGWWCDAGQSHAALLAAGRRVARSRGVKS